MRVGRKFHGYKPPGRDSQKAVANAVLFLTGARSLDGETAEGLAHRYHLSPKRAEYLLTVAKARRAARGQ